MRSHFPSRDPLLLATPVTSDDHVQGPADAEVTLLQYGDYECPYTRMSRQGIHALQREYPDALRFVYRHFPLAEIHPHARAAAEAAEAASAQGDFWTMHEYLFEHQRALEDSNLHQYAVDLGLEPERFERDRISPEVVRRIDRDRASGERSGVPGTPTFYINGVRHDGPFDVDSLRAAVAAVFTGGPGGA
jgi:protein-disulfide isomerase